jgi:hypothetical protein
MPAETTLQQRIHIAPTGDLSTLDAEIAALELDLTDPKDFHRWKSHWGREMNRRQKVGSGSRFYAGINAGCYPDDGDLPPLSLSSQYIAAIETAGASPTTEEKASIASFYDAVDLSLWARLFMPVWGVAAADAVDMVDPSRSGTWKFWCGCFRVRAGSWRLRPVLLYFRQRG